MTILIVTATIRLAVRVSVSWERQTLTETFPLTIILWKGRAHISGAFRLSRVNLNFINKTCSKFSADLEVATQVAGVLTNTKLIGSTINQVRRYGFMILKLETEFKEVLDYLTALLLCSGRGGELWQDFSNCKKQTSLVWKIVKEAGVKTNSPPINNYFPNRSQLTLIDDNLLTRTQNISPF